MLFRQFNFIISFIPTCFCEYALTTPIGKLIIVNCLQDYEEVSLVLGKYSEPDYVLCVMRSHPMS